MAALSLGQSCFSTMMPSYNSHFNHAGTIQHPSTYNTYNMFGLQSSTVSPSTMNYLPGAAVMSSPVPSSAPVDHNTSIMSCLSDSSPHDLSLPGKRCSESPTSPLKLSTDHSSADVATYKSCRVGCYSSLSPPSSPEGLSSSIVNGGHSLPLTSLSYPTAPMYSSQDCSPAALSSTVPMPMWNPYPSLPNVGPLPSPSLSKLSYDSPRYKLTPERAIPLIKWFEEHKEHPYPTRHEKIVLCQSTQLTFTQVSTWFANARRRMKKALSEEVEEESSSSQESSCSESDSSINYNSTVTDSV